MSKRATHLITLFTLLLQGCGTMNDGRAWGEDASLTSDSDRVRHAAGTAATDPISWVPALAAAALGLTHADHRIEQSLHDRTPVFNNPTAADRTSSRLRDATHILQLATLIATPSGASKSDIALNKARGLALELAAEYTTKRTVGGLKSIVARKRPNDGPHTSFPSGHSSTAFAYAALTRENVAVIDMPAGFHDTLDWTALGLATATAYARVEAGVHYPTDVLAGAAIGNFLTRFVYNTFSGTPLLLSLQPLQRGAMLTGTWGMQ
ncbi:MAG: phosphatase PAP2 family protein [Gammaproteobacteria bacterium]|nr:phosphatase PAP2 family protein [Gammaproteobacteria bacterium]